MKIESKSPKVSICMVTYNHKAYIRQAIESILLQDVDFSIELVIGDDFSTDDTFAICNEMARLDPRILVLPCERNLGVMHNSVRTLLACRGEYIALCEGDDYWIDPQKLRKQVQFLDSNTDYAGAAHQAVTMRDGVNIGNFKEEVPEIIKTENLIQGRLFHTASFLFRRQAVDLFVNSPQVLSCDRLLNLCVSFLGKIKYTNESMCVFRIHGLGLSNTATIAQMEQDLLCAPYLSKIYPEFPKYQYLSYVCISIGFKKAARLDQKIYYFFLYFIYSFSKFPYNFSDMYKYSKRKL